MSKEQRCHVATVWLTWVMVPLLAIFIGWRAGWPIGLVVAVAGVLFQMWYVRSFPRFSRTRS